MGFNSSLEEPKTKGSSVRGRAAVRVSHSTVTRPTIEVLVTVVPPASQDRPGMLKRYRGKAYLSYLKAKEYFKAKLFFGREKTSKRAPLDDRTDANPLTLDFSASAVRERLQSKEARQAMLDAFNASPDELGEAAVALAVRTEASRKQSR